MPSVVDVLRGARGLLDTPEKWWGGDSSNPGGNCAALAVTTGNAWEDYAPALDALGRTMGVSEDDGPMRGIPSFNDTHTHAEVLAAFDAAIAHEEAKAAEHAPADGIPVHRPEYGDVPGWAIPTGDPRRTQNADTLLEVMTVCDLAGQIVGELVAQDPNVTASAAEVSALASQELFASAQDVAKAARAGIVIGRGEPSDGLFRAGEPMRGES